MYTLDLLLIILEQLPHLNSQFFPIPRKVLCLFFLLCAILYKNFNGRIWLMDKKRLQQLYTCISQSDEWLSGRELAARLHLSARTIRNYVREINREKPYILSSQHGYRLNKSLAADNYRIQVSSVKPEPILPTERVYYIIRHCLVLRELSLDHLMTELCISDRTLNMDLNNVRQILSGFQLKLKIRKDSVRITGPVYEQRRLARHCIFETTGLEFPSKEFICGAFPEYDCQQIETILFQTLEASGLSVNGYERYDLLLYVVIWLREIHLGNAMTREECPVECIRNYHEYEIAGELSRRLCRLIGQSCNLWEQEYLAALLISKTATVHLEKCRLLPNYPLIEHTVNDFVRMAGMALEVDLYDSFFIKKMTCYFQRLLVRQQMKFYSQSLFFDSLKNRYPVLQDVCAWSLLHFAKQFHIAIHPSETGFLSMILCAYVQEKGYSFDTSVPCTLVCPTFGHFPGQLIYTLTERLEKAIHIDQVIETLDLEKIDTDDRLILSVIPVSNGPFILPIAPYPRSEDFRHIYEEIHKIKMRMYSRQLHSFFSSILTPENFCINVSFSSGEELIHKACRHLISMGYVSEGFDEDLLARENMDPSVFYDTLAIPHHCSEKVLREFALVVLNKEAMYWKDGYVNMAVILATRNQETTRLQKVYDLAVKVLSSRKNMDILLKAGDHASFFRQLEHISGQIL